MGILDDFDKRNRAAPFEDDMRGAAEKFNVPYEAIYGILKRESDFDPKAKNPNSSATGIGQFINSTAKQYGIDPRDPKASIYATANYLRDNLDAHKGDLNLAIASHYTGPGAANSPEGFKYANEVSKLMPGNGNVNWGTATPGSSIGKKQPSLAGMSEEQLSSVNAGLPESKRAIQTIRGNTVGWFNPQQEREFGTLGESMRGMPGEPTYESGLKKQMSDDLMQTHKEVARITGTLKNEGSMAELNRAAELAGETGKPKSAADVLAAVEGSGPPGTTRPGTVPNGPEPWKSPLSKEDQEGYEQMLSQLEKEKERKRKEQELLSEVPASLRGWYEDNY